MLHIFVYNYCILVNNPKYFHEQPNINYSKKKLQMCSNILFN